MSEFDQFAAHYKQTHDRNLGVLGESSATFDEHKVEVLQELLRTLGREGAPLSLLDFGCGIGKTLSHVRRLLPQATYSGIDMSARSVEVAGTQSGATTGMFQPFDGSKIPTADNVFDVVFISCVVHHIPPEARVSIFQEVHRVLKPGGFVFIFEHNPNNPATCYLVSTCEFDEDAALIRKYRLEGLLRQADLKPSRGSYVLFFPAVLRRMLPAAEKALGWLPLGGQYWVAAFK